MPESGPVADQALLSVPPPPPPGPKPGDGFVIPADGDPNDLSFLEGCWRTDGLERKETGQPVTYEYCFTGKGKGKATLKEFNSSGKHTGTCNATVTARRKGQSVQMRDSGLRCRGGRYYHVATLDCQNSKGTSNNCTIKTTGGASLYVEFKYVGKQ
jgi:hypothetical protein